MPEDILKENEGKIKMLNKDSPLYFILKTVTYILDEVINIRKKVVKIEEKLKC